MIIITEYMKRKGQWHITCIQKFLTVLPTHQHQKARVCMCLCRCVCAYVRMHWIKYKNISQCMLGVKWANYLLFYAKCRGQLKTNCFMFHLKNLINYCWYFKIHIFVILILVWSSRSSVLIRKQKFHVWE